MDRVKVQAQLNAPVLRAMFAAFLCLQMNLVAAQGTWQMLVKKAGIASMHTAITHFDTAILLDRTDVGKSEIDLPDGNCRYDKNDLTLKHDCTAHSVMVNINTNKVRALTVQTDTWCSSGQFNYEGTMVQTGGDYDGLRKIRRLTPCAGTGTCDWVESENEELTDGRWYASNQILPGGDRQIVVGGRSTNTYEFVPKRKDGEGSFDLQLLKDSLSAQGDNLYPFVHLLPTGNLFIFANRESVLLDYNNNKVVQTYPKIPGQPRNYPSAGSSVMLPLDQANDFSVAEVLVCGGAAAFAFRDYKEQKPASQTCGRMEMTSKKPAWTMETMPMRRTMGDMVILPTGDVLIINGAEKGAQGWGRASDAVLTPVSYATYNEDDRFKTLTAGTIPRVYHSTANLLADGRILVAGSNSHQFYTFSGAYPTELRVEAFSPAYLATGSNNIRPTITDAPATIGYGDKFTITFQVDKRKGSFAVKMVNAPFVTHSFAMGQRMLFLSNTEPIAGDNGVYTTTVTAPPSDLVAPQGYYMLFPVQADIPGRAVWARIK